VSGQLIIGVLFLVVYVPLVVWLYGRRGRWTAASGWLLLMGGALLVLGGEGDAFPWAGLLWTGVATFGVLLLAMDRVALRKRR
jgi:hypothetical protein